MTSKARWFTLLCKTVFDLSPKNGVQGACKFCKLKSYNFEPGSQTEKIIIKGFWLELINHRNEPGDHCTFPMGRHSDISYFTVSIYIMLSIVRTGIVTWWFSFNWWFILCSLFWADSKLKSLAILSNRVGLAIGRLGRYPEQPVKDIPNSRSNKRKKILIVYAHFEDGLNTKPTV